MSKRGRGRFSTGVHEAHLRPPLLHISPPLFIGRCSIVFLAYYTYTSAPRLPCDPRLDLFHARSQAAADVIRTQYHCTYILYEILFRTSKKSISLTSFVAFDRYVLYLFGAATANA
jgi:hypothetical protein